MAFPSLIRKLSPQQARILFALQGQRVSSQRKLAGMLRVHETNLSVDMRRLLALGALLPVGSRPDLYAIPNVRAVPKLSLRPGVLHTLRGKEARILLEIGYHYPHRIPARKFSSKTLESLFFKGLVNFLEGGVKASLVNPISTKKLVNYPFFREKEWEKWAKNRPESAPKTRQKNSSKSISFLVDQKSKNISRPRNIPALGAQGKTGEKNSQKKYKYLTRKGYLEDYDSNKKKISSPFGKGDCKGENLFSISNHLSEIKWHSLLKRAYREMNSREYAYDCAYSQRAVRAGKDRLKEGFTARDLIVAARTAGKAIKHDPSWRMSYDLTCVWGRNFQLLLNLSTNPNAFSARRDSQLQGLSGQRQRDEGLLDRIAAEVEQYTAEDL